MKQFHGWGLEELNNMLPWERDLYVAFLAKHVDEENAKISKGGE